jgi:hypothetical protein
MLRKFGYIDINSDTCITYIITPSGMKFYLEGGFKGFIDRNEVAKSDIDWRIKLNRWYYKNRSLPYIISGLSLLISVIALILNFWKK